MTVESHTRGHIIIYIGNKWLFKDTNKPIDDKRPCKRCNKKPIKVKVLIPASMSYTGKSRWSKKPIDALLSTHCKVITRKQYKYESFLLWTRQTTRIYNSGITL
jgi:hypothetical protein